VKLIAAVVCLLVAGCASGPVEYTPQNSRTACYRSHVGAAFEIVKIVGENPANPNEYMVTFQDRVDDMYYGKTFNIPKSKIGYECVAKRPTPGGMPDFGAEHALPPQQQVDDGRHHK
jgi:hypothetical protein